MNEFGAGRTIRGWGAAFAAAALLLFGSCGRTSAPAGDLHVAVSYDLASLDPHLDNSFEASSELSNVYESLADLDRGLRLIPALAVSWSNPDATTWSFRLRPGVRFHDGSRLSPEDVVYSIMRLKGDERLAVRSQISEVTGASVENGEVVLRTGRPSARLLNDLSQVPIVRAGSTRDSLDAHPNGTGPYAVESWTPGRRLFLRRHEGYWGAKPVHPRVEVQMSASDEQVAAGLRQGRLSIVSANSSAERAVLGSPRYRIVRQASLFVWHLGFDLSSPILPGKAGVPNPFRRLEVRQAINLALDRDRIASAWSPNAIPASQIIPRVVFGHDPGAPTMTRDTAGARRLLEAAGYRDGFDVTLHMVGATPALKELKSQLAEVGIRVSVVASPGFTEFNSALRRRELGFWMIADGCPTGEAGWLLSTNFHSKDPGRGLGGDNFAGYANPEIDRAFEEADTILDPSNRLPVLQKAVRLVESNLLWIPLFHNSPARIVDRSLAFEPREDLLLRYAEIGRQAPPGR